MTNEPEDRSSDALLWGALNKITSMAWQAKRWPKGTQRCPHAGAAA